MTVITDSGCQGVVKTLCIHEQDNKDISSVAQDTIAVTFEGFTGDSHSGLTRKSCVRVKRQYQIGTVIRNTRQISIVSEEELSLIAERLSIPAIKPEWLGANICVSGIPDLTCIPPSARLLFSGGVSLVVDAENEPCQYPAQIIDSYHPGSGKLFVKNALGCRGITAWVEREGILQCTETVDVHIPRVRQWIR